MDQFGVEAELVADAADDEVDEVIDRRWLVVEAGHGGQDDGAGAGDGDHVLQADQVEGRFARREDELAALLEVDVGRAGDEVGRHATGDRGERAHTTGDDRHARSAERAAGDPGREVPLVPVVESFGRRTGEEFRVEMIEVDAQAQFGAKDLGGGLADTEVDFAAGSEEDV